MAPLITGLGYDWAIRQTGKCIEELIESTRPDLAAGREQRSQGASAFETSLRLHAARVTITCQSADASTTSMTRAWTAW